MAAQLLALAALSLLLAAGVHAKSDDECPVYTDVLHKIYNGPVKDRPQLNEFHATWITTVVKAIGVMEDRNANFLVFGLGRDSLMWHDVNCGGRTVRLRTSTCAWPLGACHPRGNEVGIVLHLTQHVRVLAARTNGARVPSLG